MVTAELFDVTLFFSACASARAQCHGFRVWSPGDLG